MLRFLYDGSWILDEVRDVDIEDKGLLHPSARVYAVAEKYGLEELKDAVSDSVSYSIHNTKLRPDIAAAIRTVFTTTPPGDPMRDLLAHDCANRLPELFEDADFAKVVDEVAEAGGAILRESSGLLSRYGKEEVSLVKCPSCDALQEIPYGGCRCGIDVGDWRVYQMKYVDKKDSVRVG